MASGTLYTYPANFRAYKILVAAQYSGLKIKVVSDKPEFALGETNKSAGFLKKFPLGKVPAFETADGKFIFESNAIAHFVGNEQLRGKTAIDQAHIIQWINFADHEVLPAACAWVFPSLSIMQPNKQAVERAIEEVNKSLAVLNDHLLTRTYLVGERITQADIAVCVALLQLYENVLEPNARESYTNVNRWFTTLINQPQFKAVVGDLKLCEKAAVFDAKKFSEIQGKGKKSEEKKDKPKKEEKQEKKQEKSAKKEVKREKEEQPEELDETEAILAAEPQSKDPFAAFPKGTFVMDDFKRVYSNEDEKVSLPYFWDKFDKENYSIWYCEYKYPEELTMIYMSCNLIAGMFQRLDKMRKNAFGSVLLFGTDNNSTISGIFIWRGHELAFELCPDWQIDYESYSWKKLDPDVDDTKKLVNEYLSWSGDFGGKKFNQGKIFK